MNNLKNSLVLSFLIFCICGSVANAMESNSSINIAKENWKNYILGEWDNSYDDNAAVDDYARSIDSYCKSLVGKLTGIKYDELQEASLKLKSEYNDSSENMLYVDGEMDCEQLRSMLHALNPEELCWDIDKSAGSSYMTKLYQRVQYMALAYGCPKCQLHNNKNLREVIFYCLDWLYNNRYGINELNFLKGEGNEPWRDPGLSNWWDWDIGVPQKLINILIIMESDLKAEYEEEIANKMIADYLSLFDMLEPKTESTGANRVDIATEIIGSCLLTGDLDRLYEAKNDMLTALMYCDDGINKDNVFGVGQGFYTDGSYIFHGKHPMNGAYGLDHIESVSFTLEVLNKTEFAYDDEIKNNVINWYFNSCEPLMFRGAFMRMTRGRNTPPQEHIAGLKAISCMLGMIDLFRGENLTRAKSMIKTHVLYDKTIYNNGKYTISEYLSLFKLKRLVDIMEDEDILRRENYYLNKVFYNMDKVVHQREDFAFGLSMSSSRVFGYECCDGQNKNGWYLSDGMTCIYSSDDRQYSDDYWTYVNYYKLPGITVDTQKRDEITIKTGNEWCSDSDFVGGVSFNGLYGAAAMDLQSYNYPYSGKSLPYHISDLRAKKAWFMFDDEVVALGCDINESKFGSLVMNEDNSGFVNINESNEKCRVLSIVDNCLWDNEANEKKLSVGNSKEQSNAVDISGLISDSSYNLSGYNWINWNSSRGYYFPQGMAQVNARNTNSSKSFFELWFDHGEKPDSSKYSYVLLPEKNADKTREYSENPDVEIKSNTSGLQSVYEKKLGLTAGIFRDSGEMKYKIGEEEKTFVTNCPMMVMIGEKDEMVVAAFSDPTHLLNDKNSEGNKISVNMGDDYILIRADGSFTCDGDNDYNIDFTNSKGRTITAYFVKTGTDSFSKTFFSGKLSDETDTMPAKGEEIKLSTVIINSSPKHEGMKIFYGCFDENNRLLNVTEKDVAFNENRMAKTDDTLYVGDACRKINAFCWYNDRGFTPFCPKEEK